jgi:hypothetical protein
MRQFGAYPGILVVTNDADNDGIRAAVVPLGMKVDPLVGQVYRFESPFAAQPVR